MIRMMTTEEFKEKVRKINPSFEVLSDYKGGRKKSSSEMYDLWRR